MTCVVLKRIDLKTPSVGAPILLKRFGERQKTNKKRNVKRLTKFQ